MIEKRKKKNCKKSGELGMLKEKRKNVAKLR